MMSRRWLLVSLLHASVIVLAVVVTSTVGNGPGGRGSMHLVSKVLFGIAIALAVFAAIMAAYAVRVSRRMPDSR